ncbi:MAG: alpha/beta hydrolase [Caldilineaceae bacterium]
MFDARGRALAYDQLGYGLSQKMTYGDWTGDNPYTIDSAVTMLFALMDAEGIDRAILVGNSAGGPLAMAAALAAPSADGLILVDPQVYGSQALPGLLLDLPQVRRLGVLVGRALGRNQWLLRSSYFDDSRITPERIELSAIHTRVDNWDAAIWAVFSTRAAYPAQAVPQIPLLDLPVLVLNGAEDSLVPVEDSRRLAEELPNAELAVLPSCGHLPQEECPQAFEAAVAEWLGRLGD